MAQELFLTVDIGTSSMKVCVFNREGDMLFSVKREYPTLSPFPGYAEQDPQEIFTALVETVKDAVSRFPASSFEALGFDTMLHSFLLVNGEKVPLTPLLNWMDTRSFQEMEELRDAYEAENVYTLTATPLHTIYHLPRVLWFRTHQRDVFERAYKILSIKDWILWRLTGELLCDYSTASGTGLLEVEKKSWSERVCDLIGISSDFLPPLCEPDFIAPLTSREFTLATGLPSGVPVVWGGGDGPFANLGEGCFRENEMVISVGSSGAVRMCSQRPVIDPRKRAWCYYLASDIWVGGGAINNGGIVFSWMRNLLRESEMTFDLFRRRPILLPFLTGERSPYWNPYARGILFGLSFFHTPEGLLQAAYESVAFSIRAIFEMLQEVMGVPKRIVMGGGFALSEIGRKVLCNVLGTPVEVSSYPSSSAKGAFLVILEALKCIRSFGEVPEDFFPVEGVLAPQEEARAFYDRLFHLWEKLYEANAPFFQEFVKFGLA